MYGMTPDYSRLLGAANGGAGDYSKLLVGGGGSGGGGGHSDYSKLLVGAGGAMGGSGSDYSKLLGSGGYHHFMQNSYMAATQLNMGQGQLPSIVPTTY
jgi:hypothetical protein